jgi:hypothetical protein
MSTGRVISYVGAGLLIIIGLAAVFFGIIYIWGSFSPTGEPGWITAGLISVVIGLLMIAGGAYLVSLASRGKMGAVTENVTINVDLPANVNVDTLKCKSCGGSLTMDNIQMVAGAPVVNCPYCQSVYQLTEEPKW